MTDILLAQRIRDDAAFVMSRAQHIAINTDLIMSYARDLVASMPRIIELDTQNHLVKVDSPETTLAYVLALDSINFGSGVFAEAQSAGLALEYSVIAQALKSKMQAGEWIDISRWNLITADDCHETFGLPAGRNPHVDWLMREFSRHLGMTGDYTTQDFGSLSALLSIDGQRLLSVASSWPHFRDETVYQGRTVGIYKRAQILVADLALALPQARFGGVDLTCFADNMVPHVLRSDGVISYSAELARCIDRGELVESGSAVEAELRCAAIHVVSLMQKALGDNSITDVNLDHMLWHRGYLPGFSGLKPHRTITTNY